MRLCIVFRNGIRERVNAWIKKGVLLRHRRFGGAIPDYHYATFRAHRRPHCKRNPPRASIEALGIPVK